MSRTACSACGAPVAADAAFCARCGAPVPHVAGAEDVSSWLRRRWWLATIVLVAVAAMASLVTWLLTRDSGSKSDLAAGQTSTSAQAPSGSSTATAPSATTSSPATSAVPSPSATPIDAVCGTGAPVLTPTTRAERLLVTYFHAINDQDYATAFGLLADDLRQTWGSAGGDALANFSAFYRDHLRCVTVTSVRIADLPDPTVSASLGIQWYEVGFDAEYSSPLPAGSGRLLPFYRVIADPHEGPGRPDDRITGEGSGP